MLSGRCLTAALTRSTLAPCHALGDKDTPWSKCCAGRRRVAEVLEERACLGVLLPFRIWRHLACLTWGNVARGAMSVCGSACLEREQWSQGPLDRVCSSTFKCPVQPECDTSKDSHHPPSRVMTPWGCKGGNRASSVARKFPRNHLSVTRGLLSSFSVCFAIGVDL